MKTFVKRYLLFLIILVAAVLRLWRLDSIPPHLTSDEAALGYNAYSILKTGRDEYGELLPIIFKSFGDYKPGLYVYLTVPFVAIFGLNEFAVRLPSALAGLLAVWFLYLIIRNLKIENSLEIGNPSTSLGMVSRSNHWKLEILAPALLAISPWHIHFSRSAWEANVSLTLTLFGIYFFLKSLKSSKFLVFSFLFFALTLLTYQGAKLSTAIVTFILLVLFWREVIKFDKRVIIFSVVIGLIVSLPVLTSFFTGRVGRLEIFSVFSYPRPKEYLQEFLKKGNESVGDLNYYLFHTETLNFTRGILGRYFNHFGGRFLFFEGDYQNPRHSAPNHGMLLLIDLILLTVGLLAVVKAKSKLSRFSILWLLLAPLPAVLSRDQVHAIRGLNMVIPLTLVSTFGLALLITWIGSLSVKKLRVSGLAFLVLLFLSSLVYYFDSYFIHLPKHNSQFWSYGYKQIVEAVTPIQKNYEEIKIQQSFAQPYIYFLFFGVATDPQKYDPSKYQKQAKLVESEYKGDVGYIEKLDNICFCPIDWPQNKKVHGNLVVADDIRIPKSETQSDSVNLIKEIKYLNGETAFRIVEIK